MKKIILMLMLVMPLCSMAQSDNIAREKYNNVIRPQIKTKKFTKAVEGLKELLGMQLSVSSRLDYNYYIGSLLMDSLDRKQEALTYLIAAHDLEQEATKKGYEEGVVTTLMATHSMLSNYAESQQEYNVMLQMNECNIKLIDKYIKKGKLNKDDLAEQKYLKSMQSINKAKALAYLGNRKECVNLMEEQIKYLSSSSVTKKMGKVMAAAKWMAYTYYLTTMQDILKDQKATLEIADRFASELVKDSKVDDEELEEVFRMQSPMHYFILADTYYKAEKYNMAIDYCQTGLSMPSNQFWPMLVDMQGMALYKLNEVDEARKCWQAVKREVPSFYKGSKSNDDFSLGKVFGE